MSLQIVNVLYYPDGTEKTFVVGGGYTREKMKKDYCFDSCSHPPSKLEFLNMKNKKSIKNTRDSYQVLMQKPS